MRKKRSVEQFFLDILLAIGKIRQYTKGFANGNALQHDSLHWDAVIRQLEIIGEALNNILSHEQYEKAAPRYFRKVVNFRNAIVHGYFGIDPEEVWNVVTLKLDDLLADSIKLAETKHLDLNAAAGIVIEELHERNDTVSAKFLKAIFNIV